MFRYNTIVWRTDRRTDLPWQYRVLHAWHADMREKPSHSFPPRSFWTWRLYTTYLSEFLKCDYKRPEIPPTPPTTPDDSEEIMATYLQISTPCRYHMPGERCTKLFWKLHPKPNTVSELKVALEKTWENFPQDKAVPSFRKRSREYEKSSGRHFERLLYLKNCSHLRRLRLSWTRDNFW